MAPIYAFFRPVPDIEYVEGHHSHVFQCAAKSCKQKLRGVRRFLDTSDTKSTSNMHKHARKCWTAEVVVSADKAKHVDEVCATPVKGILDLHSIMTAFERKGEDKVTFLHWQHMKTESRAEIVRWVSESKRPFYIVSNCGFQSLMKTGRPECYIPSPAIGSCDVKKVFANM